MAKCQRTLCQDPGAEADHVVVVGTSHEGRIPVCFMCAVDALAQGLEAHAAALDDDWVKANDV